MNPKQLQKYRLLQEEFENECNRVANILRGIKRNEGREGRNIAYAELFELNGDNIDWSGEETWRYGGYEMHSGSFPVVYLTMTDDEIKAIVEKDNKLFLEEIEAEKRRQDDAQKAKRREQYEQLKKEFGS